MNIPDLYREKNKNWRYRLERNDWSHVPEWNRPADKGSLVDNVSAGNEFESLIQTVAVAEMNNA